MSGGHREVTTHLLPEIASAWQQMHARPERGNVAINTAVVFPMLLLIGLLLVMAGRLVLAEGVVQSAANEAARAASISRTVSMADTQARSTATSTLVNSGVRCASTSVDPATDAFALPLGTVGTITVRVECVVPLRDLGLPGAPGSRTISATGTSVLDAYRGRS
ncbi:TadE/TadG family type IV pilus assembly protein [Promicromonospora aerolata]|uniref:TadE/TadG family type IV pilus assembly protein n=1 Tax=Promicromonospora aerolata TaxID=195749 RepID=A0ABW4VBK2_9MICO